MCYYVRWNLLQEGAGPATMSAYVEIIFDNSDNRFPVTIGILSISILEI
jgi:chromosome segregation ATPase